MEKSWEEDIWFVTSVLNAVLGMHLMFRKFFFSWSPAIPLVGAVVVDQYFRLMVFTNGHRHRNYFTTKPQMLVCLCLEVAVVLLSEWIFTSMGYRWMALLAWLAFSIPDLWINLTQPCHLPQIYPDGHAYRGFLNISGFVLWGFWHGDDGYISQVVVGFILLGFSSDLSVHHMYMEADRIMYNPEYREWLLHEIGRCAIPRGRMLVDLFTARGEYIPMPEDYGRI